MTSELDMTNNIKMGDILNAIGQELAYILDRVPDGAFFYAEGDDESYSASIFSPEGDVIVFYKPTDVIFDHVIELWHTAEEEKKWAVLEYDVAEGKFEASFTFPEQLDPEDIEDDRRERALRKRFGDTPVIYPDIGPNAATLTLDDFAHLEDEN